MGMFHKGSDQEEGQSAIRVVLNVLLYAGVTALMTLSLAFGLSSSDRDAAKTAALNIAITRAGVDTALCVLLTDPQFRDQETIEVCAKAHGYEYTSPVGQEVTP